MVAIAASEQQSISHAAPSTAYERTYQLCLRVHHPRLLSTGTNIRPTCGCDLSMLFCFLLLLPLLQEYQRAPMRIKLLTAAAEPFEVLLLLALDSLAGLAPGNAEEVPQIGSEVAACMPRPVGKDHWCTPQTAMPATIGYKI
jgi:hypothetical protein